MSNPTLSLDPTTTALVLIDLQHGIVGMDSTASWAGVMPTAWWIRKADWRQAFRLTQCAWQQCDACFLP